MPVKDKLTIAIGCVGLAVYMTVGLVLQIKLNNQIQTARIDQIDGLTRHIRQQDEFRKSDKAVIGVLRDEIVKLTQELAASKAELAACREQSAKTLVEEVTVTAYNFKGNAASMKQARPGTVAVSHDLFNKGWVFGRKVYIKGVGVCVINDLMHERYKKRIDVFIGNESEAKSFGVNKAVAAVFPI